MNMNKSLVLPGMFQSHLMILRELLVLMIKPGPARARQGPKSLYDLASLSKNMLSPLTNCCAHIYHAQFSRTSKTFFQNEVQDYYLHLTLRLVKFLSSGLFGLPHQLIPNCPAHHWQSSFPCLPTLPCLLIAHSLPMAPHCHGNHMSWIFQDILISNILSCGQTMCQIICQKIRPILGFGNMITVYIASPISSMVFPLLFGKLETMLLIL